MTTIAETLALPRAAVRKRIALSFPRKLILAFAVAIAIPLFGYAVFVHAINGQRMRMLDEAALNQRLVVVTQHVRAMGLRVVYTATAARDEWLQTASHGKLEVVGPAFLRELADAQDISAAAILGTGGTQAPAVLGRDLALDAMLTETSHAAAALDGEASWGVVGHRDSLVVVGAAPVKSRDGSDTTIGAILVGRQITANEMESVMGAGVCKATLCTLNPADPIRTRAGSDTPPMRSTSGFSATSVDGDSTSETVSMSMVFASGAREDAPSQLTVVMDRSALPGRGPRFVTVAFGAFACALLLGALLTSLVSNWVNQPLEELRERVEDLAAGKRGAPPLQIETDDSLGRLARAFNHMVASREETQELLLHNERLAMAGKLSAAIAHEVKNVLAPIHLRAELLMQCVRDPLARENLEGMQAEIDRGAALLRNLLDLARNSGTEMRAVAVDELLARAADLVAPQLNHSSTALSVSGIGDETLIWGDQSELLQVLVNLVNNAVDAHAKHVTLSADKADGHLRITVTDDGIGMDEATRQRALEPFFTTKPCGKGTGLGLSICHSVAEAHGGTLGIESQRHAGTRVSLCLPAIGED